MSLIPYPSQIKPSRVTAQLVRTDELFASPVTGIQQVASRGNAFWRWTIEYRDISESERDIVQAFLMKCRGSLNTFKIPDFAQYGPSGAASDWTDLHSGNGQFLEASQISYFNLSAAFDYDVFDGQGVNITRNSLGTIFNLRSSGSQNSHDDGAAYLARAEFYSIDPKQWSFAVGSLYDLMYGPSTIESDSAASVPYFIDVTSIDQYVSLVNRSATGAKVGDQYQVNKFRTSRCALVSNSENLLLNSNSPDDTGWNNGPNTLIASGGLTGPSGVVDGARKYYGTAVTNSYYYLTHSVTKNNTSGLYTLSLYAKAAEQGEFELGFDGAGTANRVKALFWLNSGSHTGLVVTGNFTRPIAKMFDVGSGWYRCVVSAVTGSESDVRLVTYLHSGTSNDFTNDGSSGIWIANAQLREHPFAGHYVQTSGTAVVGTGWQTGSELYIEGLDPGAIYKSGSRFELINQYHDATNNLYQRSEFKRLTSNLKASKEGWGIVKFDPPIRNAPEYARSLIAPDHPGELMHNALVFDEPELTARLLGSTVQYIEKPLQLSDVVFDIIEDLAE